MTVETVGENLRSADVAVAAVVDAAGVRAGLVLGAVGDGALGALVVDVGAGGGATVVGGDAGRFVVPLGLGELLLLALD